MKRKFTKLLTALGLLALFILPMNVSGETISFIFTGNNANCNATSGSVSGITYASDKTGSANACGYNTTNGLVLYGVANGGGYFYTTTAINGSITNIEATTNKKKNSPKYTVYGSTDGSNWTQIGNQTDGGSTANFATSAGYTYIKLANTTAATAQLGVNSIVITYTPNSTPVPSLSVNPTSVAFGEKAINPANPYTETFTVTYGYLTENLSVNVGSGLIGVSVDPSTISKDGNGTQQVTVSYDPTSVGSISGNITISNTNDNLSKTVAVSGSSYDPASIVYYEKVTEAPADWSGVYIVTYAAASSFEALTGVSNNLGTHAPVSVSSDRIVSNSTVDAYAVTIVKTTGNQYSMQLGSQYLYAQASNNLYASNDFTSGSCEWTIEYNTTTDLVEITNVTQSTRLLQYNTSSPRFACYTGSQKNLTLFKYQGTVILPLAAPVVTLEAGNGTITYTWAAVANAQSYTLEWSTSSTFADDVHEVTPATSGNVIPGLSNGTTYYVRVKAIGDGTNYSDSDWSAVVSATPTTIVVTTPTFSVDGISTGNTNEYVEAAEVTITAPDHSTHSIYYTTDGSDPDDSSEAYDGTPIDVLTTTTIKAIAYDGLNESEIGSIEVTIVETTPIATVFAATAGDDYYYIDGIVTYKGGNKNLYVEDSNGGILVYKNDNNFGSSVSVGNRIVVKGQRKDAYGQPRFENPTILDNDGQTHDLPLSEIAVSQADDYMFRRVKFTQVQVGATANNLTPITQGANSVNVYNIPSVENVTEEGYYLKSLTGIVATYSQATQIYVASENDIIAYTIDASSNNTTLGTVSANGYVVTATPATGIEYADPAYVTVVGDGVTCTVTQTGDEFKVVTNGDAAIEIQFASAPIYTISYTTNGIAEAATTEVLQSTGEITELITPTAANIPNGYVFMGWTTSAISGSQNNAPDFIEVGDVIDDNTSLIAVFAIENQGVSTETVTLTANSSWSSYQDKTFTDDANNEWTANCTGQNVSGTYYYGLKADVSSYVHSPNFSGTITGIKIWGKNGSSTVDRTFYIKSTQNGASGDLGAVSVPASTDGEELTATLTGSFTSFYLGASGALQFSKLQVSYNGVSNSYSNYCTSVAPIEENDLPINNNNELTQDYTISGVNYLDTYIIVPDGITLTVDGTLGNSDPDFLVVEDGGQLIHTAAVSATVKKNINPYTEGQKDGWYTISSSAAGSAISTATQGTYDFYRYDEENALWLNQENDANAAQFANFNQGVGYLYANSVQTTLSFAGSTPGTSTQVSVPMSYACTVSNDLKGFNLVGNPFTRNLTSGDIKLVKDGSNDVTVTAYYVAEDDANLVSRDIATYPIKPGQGFFVQVNEDGWDLVFNKQSQQRGGGTDMKPSFVVINAGNENFIDRAYVQIGQGNTLRKMTINDNTAKVYVMNDGKDYAAATITEAVGELPVSFKAAEDGTYTISVETENLEASYLHLIDNMTGADIDLLQTPSYSFEAKTTDYSGRFRLAFNANGVNGTDTDEAFAFISDGNIVITGAEADATVQVIDMMGRIVASQGNGTHTVSTEGMAKGVYVIRLVESTGAKTQKIVVK